jgi:hypothetical protein
MAEEKKKEEKAAKPSTKSKGGGGKLILLMTLAGCFIPFGVPTLLVCVGLLPSLVALVTDTDENRSGLATIGYLNLAGVLPSSWNSGKTDKRWRRLSALCAIRSVGSLCSARQAWAT